MSDAPARRHRRRGVLMCLLMLPMAAHASDHGTAPEAEALVKRVIAYIQTHGADKAYDEITNGTTFKDRDLHVVVYTLDGRNLAHGAHGRTVGKDRLDVEDPDGKPVVRHFIEIARRNGRGWSEDYKLMNPATMRIEGHSMYIERLGNTFVGCSIYKRLERVPDASPRSVPRPVAFRLRSGRPGRA